MPSEDFAKYIDQKTVVIMDIERGKLDLPDLVKYPILKKMEIQVKLLDGFTP